MDAAHSFPGDRHKYRYWVALRAWRSGDHASAARLFETLTARGDLCGLLSRYYAADANLRSGLSALRGGRSDDATRHFRTALRLNPRHASLPRFLADGWSGPGGPVAVCGGETPATPGRDSRLGLAFALWRQGRTEAALAVLRHGVQQDPHNVAWRLQFGVMLGACEQHHAAIEQLQAVLQAEPQHVEARLHLGLCHGALNEPRLALDHLRRAQNSSPADSRVALFLALACKACGQAQPVDIVWPDEPQDLEVPDVEALTRLLREEPDVVAAFVSLPEQPDDHDVLEQLSAALQGAVQTTPGRATLHYHLARVRERLGDREGAAAAYQRTLDIDPDDVPALIARAKLDCLMNRRVRAMAGLERVLGLGFDYADVHYLLGCLYRDQGDASRARQSFARALHINARYRAAQEALAGLAA